MPIINEDEDLTKNKETPVGGGTSYIGGGASSAGAASGSTAGPTQVSKAPGSGFTNLQTYLGGDQASSQMGGMVAGQGDQLGGAATTAVNSFSNDVIGGANAGVPVLNNAATVKPGYSGPQAYNEGAYGTSFGTAKKAVADTGTYANMSNDANGIQNQLKDMTPGKYSQGENALDAATVTSGVGRNQVQDMQQRWSGLGGYLDSAKTGATNAIGAAKAKGDAVGAQWQTAQDNLKAANAANTARTNAAKDAYDKKIAKDKADTIAAQNTLKTGITPKKGSIVENSPITRAPTQPTGGANLPGWANQALDGVEMAAEKYRKYDPLYAGFKQLGKWLG